MKLGERLKEQLRGRGSTLFDLTWQVRATPAGRPYYQLAASARPISERDCGSSPWPTPCVVEPDTHPEKVWERKQRLTDETGIYRGNDCGLGSKVQLTSWPTTTAKDADASGIAANWTRESGRHSGTTLTDAARLANQVVHSGPISNGSPAPTASAANSTRPSAAGSWAIPQSGTIAHHRG
jgi:hypothetical protein